MFTELAKKRRSIKNFTAQQVEREKIDAVLETALRSPSGRGTRPWHFVVVKDKALLEKLSVAKPAGAAFLKDAALGIVICGDPSKSNLWIEDCSIAAVTMQYAAHSLGLGSRWAHIRGNKYNDSKSSTEFIAELLNLPNNLEVECMVAIGYPGEEMVPYRKDQLAFDKVSYDRYGQKSA
ncbi:MAG: nitroreductase family protein [Desulfobacterales bacterium]|nr:nitroreductase family protein [Desulfobacterales bacterium]